ncbi:hypothetical protein EHS25_005328 [Saitozyma podzolica]|uniref:Xylanolytic transcriptional activator regulatory domain-containing protein n=1 Tax=Saitozyma podzolica TaxID=1890683 RepID=A0A427XZ42_9TREE|nr:hypothetical protein EHS25_005328 [Saitozyma podzolica]
MNGGVSQQQDVLGENGPMEMPGGDLAPLPPRASRPSRVDISFSHVIPGEGDSSPFLPIAAEAARQTAAGDLEQLLREDCPDPVTAGLLSEADAFELFEFYFRHLNITVAILDPVLHTPSFCRDRSTLLFTAVLTVTAKIIRPKAYSHCLMLSNKLVGQAVEYGLCSIEIVQAIILLTHWKKADDTTAWRRAGYAVRMAQELKLNVKRARPLPKNERQAREVLNTERTWLNLIISDYHLAIHHSLPRMIAEEGINDPADWVQEHPHITCPGEAALAPRIQFGRMCRLYADMLAGMSGDEANLRMLEWLELEWKRWRSKWLLENHGFEFTAQQVSTTKMDDAFFRFHIAEYRLLYTARYHSQGRSLDASEPTPLSFAFSECVDAALGVPAMFQNEFVRHRYLPYCFVRVWVALAVTSVWLVKNIVAMRPTDRSRVIRTLSEVQSSTEEASRSSDDMSAYTHRLLKHLLSGISPEWQFSSLVPTQRTGQALVTGSANPNTIPPTVSVINGSGAGSASHADAQVQHHSSATWAATSAQEIIQDHLWNQHDPKFSFGTMPNAFQNTTFPADPEANAAILPQPSTHPDDVLFPAADDEFWRLFFPTTDGPAAV